MKTIAYNEIMTYQDKLYLIYRKIKQERIKEGCVNELKSLWFCDIVVKNKNMDENMLLFLREISEAEIVSD